MFWYYSDHVLLQQLEHDLVWNIAVAQITVLTVFRFPGTCRQSIVGFTCHGGRKCCNGHGVLWPLALEILQGVDEIGLSWF